MNWIENIKNYVPFNEQEKRDKEVILRCIDDFEDILFRENPIAHMTSSSFILNKDCTKILMVYHNIYNSWSWTGGHTDGDNNLLHVAIKEAIEETGLKNAFPVSPEIFAIDVLPVLSHTKNNSFISSHLHLNITYLLRADENETLSIKPDENSGVKWIHIDEVVKSSSEIHMQKVYSKLISKIQKTTS